MLLFTCKRDLRLRITIAFIYFLNIPNFCCPSCDLHSSGKGQCTPADQRLGPSITPAAKQLREQGKKSLGWKLPLYFAMLFCPPKLKKNGEKQQYFYVCT